MSNHLVSCGPFLSSSVALHSLSENLYQHRLLSEAIDMYNEYQQKIQEAIDNNDEDHAAALKKESEYYDQIFQLSISTTLSLDEA